MQFIRDIIARKRGHAPVISMEFFPPRTDEGDRNLIDKTIPALMRLQPDFCSVTYGAGGSTRDKTLNIVERIQSAHGLTGMSHLTCVNSTREELEGVLQEAKARGIKNILALRGDPPPGTGDFKKTPGGFEYSSQLVEFIRSVGGFSIGTAGFPEGHIACQGDRELDWQRLKTKVDAGADFVITQLFFDNADFLRFRDYVRKLGVTVPIFPGMLPILSGNQIKKFTTLCGATIPQPMQARLDELGDNDEAVTAYGIDYATTQCAELLREGVEGLHFYTLNKVRSTVEVLRNLNLAPAIAA